MVAVGNESAVSAMDSRGILLFFCSLREGEKRIELKATNIKRQQLVTHALYGIKHSSDTDRLFVALFPLVLLLPFHSRSLSNEAHQREAKKMINWTTKSF